MPWRLAPGVALATLVLGATGASGAGRSDPEVVALLERLVNGRESEKSRAIERLRALGVGRAGPALREWVNDGSDRERIVATEALTALRDPGSAPVLEKALSDADWEVRRNAAQALALLPGRAPKPLVRCLEREKQARVLRACIDAAARRGGASAALVGLVGPSNEVEVRLQALNALAKAMDTDGAKKLRPHLDDDVELVRFATARVLAWAGDPSGRRFLTQQLTGPDPERSIRALHVLGDVPRSWAGDLVSGALGSPDADVRHAAARTLESRGDARGRRKMQEWLDAGSPADAQFARQELARLGSQETP